MPDPTPAEPGIFVPARSVRGRWFIPTLFVSFVLFTLLMSYGTVWVAQAMRPMLQKRTLDAERRKVLDERKAMEAARPAR